MELMKVVVMVALTVNLTSEYSHAGHTIFVWLSQKLDRFGTEQFLVYNILALFLKWRSIDSRNAT